MFRYKKSFQFLTIGQHYLSIVYGLLQIYRLSEFNEKLIVLIVITVTFHGGILYTIYAYIITYRKKKAVTILLNDSPHRTVFVLLSWQMT